MLSNLPTLQNHHSYATTKSVQSALFTNPTTPTNLPTYIKTHPSLFLPPPRLTISLVPLSARQRAHKNLLSVRPRA